MAVVQMQRMNIFGLKADRKQILERVQRWGLMEVDIQLEDAQFSCCDTLAQRQQFDRQIRALQMVHGEERERLFKETEEAVQFYDAHIKTGNDVLDTILTEKSFVCARQGIRFSCNIHAEKMDMIDVIDFTP